MDRFAIEKYWPEAIVVYCDGLPMQTAGGGGKGWELRNGKGNRDLKFFDALLPQVMERYQGDPKKVYAWGFSNGGMFVYTLWATRADKFTAFCASGASTAFNSQPLSVAKPAFITIADNDSIVPTSWQERAFKQVEKANQLEGSAFRYKDVGMQFEGKARTFLWRYHGGHEFPFECFPKLIEFFKSVAPSSD